MKVFIALLPYLCLGIYGAIVPSRFELFNEATSA